VRAAAEGSLRLLDAGTAPPPEWRTLPPPAQAQAQRRAVEELVRRCDRAGVSPAELLEACSRYRDRWWPRAGQLLDLVDRRRAELAAEESARQLDLPDADDGLVMLAVARSAAGSASLPVLEREPEPAPVVGLAALEAARQRRAAAGGSRG
jgi:hypothetical protein